MAETVKLLSEEELRAVEDDGNSLLVEGGRTMQAIDYPLYERLVGIARAAAKAYAGMSLIREQHDRIAANSTFLGAVTGKSVECGCTACNVLRIILRELTPPTPEERR